MILGQFAGGPAVRTDYNQTDPSKADYLVGRENIAPKTHVEDKNNPHGVTAAQVGAAPSGYGLGTSIRVPKDNDANNFRANGFFACLKNAPLDNGNWFVGYSTYWSDYGYQVVWNVSRTDYQSVCRRTILPNNQFGEWEWDNPPMVLGEEYRTTERYNGKPVYTKLINGGALPNATSKGVELGTAIVEAVRITGKTSQNITMPNGHVTKLLLSPTGIEVETNTDASHITFTAMIYYTKS